MLVCSVSLRPKRGTLAAAIVEIATATDAPSISAVFAILADDPGNARDTLDGFVGKVMVEAASAADIVNAGSIRNAAIVEETGALASPGATVIDSSGGIAATMAEATAADGAPDATITSGTATAVIDAAFVTTTTTSTVLGTEVPDSGPTTSFD